MVPPLTVTSPARDFDMRTHTAFDLERTLGKFLKLLFVNQALDNPALNEDQPAEVPFDYTERAQMLEGKVAPQIIRGRIPRTVTGEIEVDKLPDFPHVIVQTVAAKVETQETLLTVRLLFGAYDENPKSHGYQDVLNMIETAAIALTTYGQGALDQAYPIVMPIEWKLIEADAFPHFLGEMTTTWQLPSGRPLPDSENGLVPGEQISMLQR